jgi:ABC-type hemin transport system substrate-binding protein
MRVGSSVFAAARALLWAAAIACSPGATPPRVVSLAPEGTRALAVLGLSGRLVAVDPGSRPHAPSALPTATLENALSHEPDLILVAPAPPDREEAVEALRQSGVAVLEVAPHQFDEAFALYREIAAALGDESRGRAAARRIGDPLAQISTQSLGQRRPLVAPLVSLDPLVLAGGHSFVADLVEVAGAETTTHASEAPRLPARVDEIRAARPELVLVALPELPARAAQEVVRSWFDPLPVAFVPIDSDVWLTGAFEAAEAIRAALNNSAEAPTRGAR